MRFGALGHLALEAFQALGSNYLRVFLNRGANRNAAPDGIGARVSIRVGSAPSTASSAAAASTWDRASCQPTSASSPRR